MHARRLPFTVRLLVPAALLLVALGAVGGSAQAAIPWAPCSTAGFECARVSVPLDYSGATPGAVSLAVSRVPAATNPTNTAVVPLAGGPGQAALPISKDFAQILTPAITDRDLLIYDQRGTGSSGVLSCSSLSRDTTVFKAAAGCASELGGTRGFYRTAESVADIEALRVAGGYAKLVLFGVSYGTKVAEAYAAAYPQNVEALVLDSVVLPEGPDPFQRSTLTGAPRVLGDLCANDACASATNDVKGDLTRLAAKLRKRALRGKVTLGSGRRVSFGVDQTGLLDILLAGDLNPTLRAELPGSMRAALRGDASPLLRLSVRSEGLTTGLQAHASNADDSDALFLATTCEEAPFAWTRTAGADQRATEVTIAAKAIPKAQLGPFSPAAAVQGGPIPYCLGWPDASPAPIPSQPLPAVRTLVLDGQMDLRTPYEDAAQLATRIPGADIVEIPFTGHSTVTSDASTGRACTKGALATFFAGGVAGPCTPGKNPFAPTRRPPTSLGQIALKSRTKQTIAAAEDTVTDAARQIIGDAIALNKLPRHVGGLRGGNATVTSAAGAFRLTHYQYVPGVLVSGTVDKSFSAKVTIRGGGALGGRLTISSGGAVSGTLGGKRVHIAASTSVHRSTLPTVASVLARPHLG
jgi:pimeloyl-ACP methyl ester carboxylesterase